MIELHSPQYLKVTFALAFGSFLVFCNLYLFQPMLPYLANHFAVSETQINWLFAASTLALSLCLVPWAVTSEAVGRRLVMLTGLFAMPVIGLAMLYAEQFWFLVLTRALMGVALAAFASVAVAYMVEELSPQAFGKAIGGYIAANSLGGIPAALLEGYSPMPLAGNMRSLRWPFLLCSARFWSRICCPFNSILNRNVGCFSITIVR